PQALHHSRPEIRGHDVGDGHEALGDLLSLLGLEVEDDAPLVAVEQEEEIAVDVRAIAVPELAGTITERRTLDLDDVGAEPGQHLRARGPSLVVREVDDADPLESLAHSRLLLVLVAPRAATSLAQRLDLPQ